ncbi:hypothetical protein C8F01DRAFT_1274973 [Mycena amicta]|nr:hypothetical protein C8F01DRAFT_1274973 [Mycena amicta]
MSRLTSAISRLPRAIFMLTGSHRKRPQPQPESAPSPSPSRSHHCDDIHFPDEILLLFFSFLDDIQLLALAAVSKHIHEMALQLHLERHGVALSDVHNGIIPLGTRSGAVQALSLARFVASLHSLNLRFDGSEDTTTQRRSFCALDQLCTRLTTIPAIRLEVHTSLRDIHGTAVSVLNAVIDRVANLQHPLICITPRGMRMIPWTPSTVTKSVHDIGYALATLTAAEGSDSLVMIFGPDERDRVCIGVLLLVDADCTYSIHIRQTRALRPAAVVALLHHISAPHLATLQITSQREVGVQFDKALADFIGRHPALQTMKIEGAVKLRRPSHGEEALASPHLTPGALPHLYSLQVSVRIAAWLLLGDTFTQLSFVRLELHGKLETQDDYQAALLAISLRPRLNRLRLEIFHWVPWEHHVHWPESQEPERLPANISQLVLAFRPKERIAAAPGAFEPFIAWLKRWPGLNKLTFYQWAASENEVTKDLVQRIQREVEDIGVYRDGLCEIALEGVYHGCRICPQELVRYGYGSFFYLPIYCAGYFHMGATFGRDVYE